MDRTTMRRAAAVLSVLGMTMVGFSTLIPVAPASATPDKNLPMKFTPEAGTNSFTAPPVADNSDCKGIIPTPGSDPATKQIDLTDGPTTFAPGTLVPFVVHDNAHANEGNSSTYTLHDCVASYTSGQLSSHDFENGTGEPLPGHESQVKNYTAVVDQAHLTGIPSNTTDVHYSWQIPSDAVPGTVFCNFVKDTGNNHGGGGNRKAGAACFQVPQGLTVTKTVSGPLQTPWSFVAHIVCTNDPNSPYDLTLSNATPSGTVSPVPSGSTCTVTETNSHGAAATTITPNNGVVTIPTTGNVSVGILNTFRATPTPGSLTVTKSVAGGAPEEWEFTAHVVCTKQGSDNLEFDLPLTDEVPSATHSNIAAGSQCTVTEPTHPRTTVVISPNGGVVTVGEGGASVAIVNTFPPLPGGLTVTKTVSGDTAPREWDFTAHVVCTKQGSDDLVFDLPLSDEASSATHSDIPAGSQCTVTEPNAPPGDTVTVSPNGGVVTIPSGSNTQVGILNAYPSTTGSLTVTKSVTGANQPQEWSFTAHVVCTPPQVEDALVRASSVNSFDLVLTSGDSDATRTGLPAGTTCTVTEPDHKGATTVTIVPSGGVVTITAGQDSEVDITNDFPGSPPPPPAVTPTAPDLSVVKVGPSHAKVGDFVTYTMTVTNNGTAPTSNPVTVTDVLDPNTAFTTGSPGCVSSSNVVTCTLSAPLGVGTSASVSITVLILSNTTASSVTDIATVASTGIPGDIDDSSSATTTIDKVEATGGTKAPSATPPAVVPPVVTPPAAPVVVPKATLPVAVLPETASRTLPFTGTNVRLLLLAGLGLLLLGLGLVAGTWRMPRARHYR